MSRSARPTLSVVVLAYQSRDRIDIALSSLREQELEDAFEVIVVDSGSDGCSEYVRHNYPEARLVCSPGRLLPGAARNWGLTAASGEYVAFLADDCAAAPNWLRERLALHRDGFDLVGGSVANGTPRSVVGTAGYLLEYSAVMPVRRVLEAQEVPHSLSYSADVFARLGSFPEDTRTGEDTLFNKRCMAAGATAAFAPEAHVAHRNLTGFRAFLRHQYTHGEGFAQCILRHDLEAPTGTVHATLRSLTYRMLVRYPAVAWFGKVRRLKRNAPARLPAFLALSPIIWAGLLATGLGAWEAGRRESREGCGSPSASRSGPAAAPSQSDRSRDSSPAVG
jgi:glycosyltransferase involved in cell wall biosynthesis